MSVATKNPFALLDEADSPSESPSSTPQPLPSAPAPARPSQQKNAGGPASKGGKYYQRGGAAKSSGRDSGNLNQNGIDEPADAQRKPEGGRGRGARGARGGGGGGASRGGRGRQFDKHSQTGKTDSDKKIHQSWGGDDGNTELKQEEAATNDAVVESNDWAGDASATADAWGAPAAADADAWAAPAGDAAAPAADVTSATADKPDREGRPRREREPEEEDNTLTLDQYLSQQKEKEDSIVPKLEGLRVANDGDDGKWGDVVPLQKDAEADAYFVGKNKAAPKPRAKKEEKVFLDIDPQFPRPNRGAPRGGGRGGRGGDRGDRGGGRGRGRGGSRGGPPNGGGYNNTASVNVDDQVAFPSLT